MKPAYRKLLYACAALLTAEQLWLVYPYAQRLIFPPQQDEAAAGRRIAEGLGCLSCHGPDGGGGMKNPGSENKIVPALSGGEMMMWAESEEQLREWVLYGHRLDAEEEKPREGLTAGQGSSRALVMPAFESHLGTGELDLLLSWLKSISGLQFPSPDPDASDQSRRQAALVASGLELSYELGCFGCHGAMGTGGVSNPGSLKGYVPGFFGEDFGELVLDDDEAREWIADGVAKRLRDHPLASMILERQAIKMPAYGEFLEEEEVDSLVAVVGWLAEGRWRDLPVP